MPNSDTVMRELQNATSQINQALRAYASNRPDPNRVAKTFNHLVAAITNIDARLVALEQTAKDSIAATPLGPQ